MLKSGEHESVGAGCGSGIRGLEGERKGAVEDIGEGAESGGGCGQVEKKDRCDCLFTLVYDSGRGAGEHTFVPCI